MKKKITYLAGIIVILAFLTFLFTTTSYAGTQRLNDLKYDVVLNGDGSANVVETWNIRISETNTLFKTFELDSKKYGNITNVEVAEVNQSGEVTNFQDTGVYAYHVQKGGFYALKNSSSEFEIAWGVHIEDTETRTYRIKYKIENAIKTYTDCSEFYWQFIGDTNGIPARKVTGNITLPKEVSNRENLKVWAHGPLHGNIEIVDNKKVTFEVEDLDTETMVEVRVVTAENVFSQNMNIVNTSKLDSIVEEETRWADEANAKRDAARKAVMTVIIIIAVVSVVILVIFTFVIVRYVKTLRSIKKVTPEQEMKYFRDFPDENATPAEAAFLYYFDKQGAFKNNVSKIVSATILNLALKKIISFEQDEKNNVYIVLNKDYREVKNTDESNVYNILANVEEYIQRHSKEEQDRIRISMKDIENYAKKNDQKFLSKIEGIEGIVKTIQTNKGNYSAEEEKVANKWKNKSVAYYSIAIILLFMGFAAIIPIFIAILLFVCGILCGKIAKKLRNLTQKGTNEQEAWKGLKRYMEDFSLLNEREVPDLILWEKYLVYATAFGIADKVLAQLKIKYPQLADESYMISNGYTYMYMMNRMNFDRMIMSGINKAYNTGIAQRQARIAASSYSSRRWRWPADSLAVAGFRWRWRPEWAEDKRRKRVYENILFLIKNKTYCLEKFEILWYICKKWNSGEKMRELVRYEKYSRKDIHDIFSPDTKFTSQAGTWGIQGIIRVPETQHDYIFLVTYGKKQAGHEFDENIDENGILTWQSQPSQTLNDSRIIDFINHDYLKNNIYLFLRTSDKEDYTYMGLLAYVDHDNQREKPVYFKWQILDWNDDNSNRLINDKKINAYYIEKLDIKKFILKLNKEEAEYLHESESRKGKNTSEFYSNKNINFEGEIKKNTELGKRGEDIVVEYEKSRLIMEGREDLADKVFATREIAGNAERFDVLSYDKDGNEKYIEVKTTKGGLNNIFHISENEVEFSEQYKDKYYLYRVYNFNTKTMSADLKIIKGAINREKLKATNYTCRIGGKNNENI